MNKIEAIMLKNGAEFIAEVTKDEYGRFGFRNPVTIFQDNTGQARFAPWFGFAEAREYEISSSEILIHSVAGAEIVSGYQQAFGLIQTPDKKIIV